ncbi:MAG: helix-turn-helix transcriptional regulator [Pseudomonadota bacterium]
MTRLKDLEGKWREDPEFVAEYEAVAEEFAIAEALIRARSDAGMTQAEVAAKMETSQSRVARLEGGANASVDALKRYADATGTMLRISFEPLEAKPAG